MKTVRSEHLLFALVLALIVSARRQAKAAAQLPLGDFSDEAQADVVTTVLEELI